MTGCILVTATITIICIYTFSKGNPAKMFKNAKRSDIRSIKGESFPEGSQGELTGDNIDKFIQIMKNAEYKRSDRTDHYGGVIHFTVRFANDEEHTIVVIGSYGSDNILYKGFIKIDNYPYYECDTKELQKLYYINSNSRYKEWYQQH